jgi:hypothetical protein
MRRTSPQTRTRRLQAMFAAVLIGASASAGAQQVDGFEGFDASVLLGSASDVLARTPDAQVDGLFQALHGSMRQPAEAEAICSLFDADADRGIDSLNATAMRLPEASRQRFADAVAQVVVAGLQSPPQRWDRAAATQALKANGTRAALLHDGFTAGLAPDASRDARCGSLGAMLDVLADRPREERVPVTRLLLEQGLKAAQSPR